MLNHASVAHAQSYSVAHAGQRRYKAECKAALPISTHTKALLSSQWVARSPTHWWEMLSSEGVLNTGIVSMLGTMVSRFCCGLPGALPEGKWCMSFTSGWRAKLCLLVWFWDSPFWLRSLLEHRLWQMLFCFLLHSSGHRAVNKPQAFWGASQSTSASSSQWGSVGVTENQVTKKLNSH